MTELDLEVLEMLGVASAQELATLSKDRWAVLEEIADAPIEQLSGTDPLIGTCRQH